MLVSECGFDIGFPIGSVSSVYQWMSFSQIVGCADDQDGGYSNVSSFCQFTKPKTTLN